MVLWVGIAGYISTKICSHVGIPNYQKNLIHLLYNNQFSKKKKKNLLYNNIILVLIGNRQRVKFCKIFSFNTKLFFLVNTRICEIYIDKICSFVVLMKPTNTSTWTQKKLGLVCILDKGPHSTTYIIGLTVPAVVMFIFSIQPRGCTYHMILHGSWLNWHFFFVTSWIDIIIIFSMKKG